ncbi:MAG: tRNA 2-selenouridine(34) synthase MnmH, partial [Bacteroidia bacterium]|nr:tRNA 2-selenouridine(34) synthase MnmH [Bacteroidia bacterium]
MSLIHLPEEYLKLVRESGWLLLDTRSPSEYRQAHIPGAINLPLLNDEHRAAVGTAYKQQGRDAAVLLGFELVGPSFAGFVKQVRELTENREI